jgi:hypothetical protein
MKISKISALIVAAIVIGSAPAAIAEDATVDRATRVEQIRARWNPVFDTQFVALKALEAKAKLDPIIYKTYKSMYADFIGVRKTIEDALNNPSADVEGAASYAEEETGEFATTIPELTRLVNTIKTITCIKGKTTKKVSGTAPKCPAGYKKK